MWIVGECCARVSPLRWVGFLLVVLFVVSFAVNTQEDSGVFGEVLPLWEPYWSPQLLSAGASTYLEADDADSFCMLDIFRDEKPELIVGGRLIHVLTLFDGNLYEECPYLGEEFGLSREGVWAGDMACGDMDGDGEEDLVVVNSSAGVRVFLNKRRHGLAVTPESPYQFPAEYYDVMIEDHTRDGLLDAIVYGGENALVLPGNGEGGFEEGLPLDGYEGSIWALVPGEYKDDSGLWLLSDEGLWFFPQSELLGIKVQDSGGRALAVADFDLNGDLDLAISRGRSTVEVYLADPDELVEPTLKLELDRFFRVELVLPGDLNGDNWPDLVAVCERSPAKLAVFYNLGHSTFGEAYQIEIRNYGEVPGIMINPEHRPRLHTALITDLTDDGRDDVVLSADGHFVAVLTPSPKPVGRCFQSHAGHALLGAFDLDGDGTKELLSGNWGGRVEVLHNNGFGLFQTAPLVEFSLDTDEIWTPEISRLGDINGDGLTDLIVWGRTIESEVRVVAWYGGRDGTEWKLGWMYALPADLDVRRGIFCLDLDGNGKDEVVLIVGSEIVILSDSESSSDSQVPNEAYIKLGTPITHFSPIRFRNDEALAGFIVEPEKQQEIKLILVHNNEVIETTYQCEIVVQDLAACDLDEDGSDDLVFVGVVPVEEGDPAIFTYGKRSLEDEELTPFAVVVGMLLGDGESGFSEQIVPILGWPKDHIPMAYGGLTLGDFNGDGLLDLASGVLPFVESPGGVVVLLRGEEGLEAPVFLEGGRGFRPLALDVNEDGQDELVLAIAGGQLCLLAWRDVE